MAFQVQVSTTMAMPSDWKFYLNISTVMELTIPCNFPLHIEML